MKFKGLFHSFLSELRHTCSKNGIQVWHNRTKIKKYFLPKISLIAIFKKLENGKNYCAQMILPREFINMSSNSHATTGRAALPLGAARTVQWTGLHSTRGWRHRHAVITVQRQVEAAVVESCQSDAFCWMLQLTKYLVKYIFILPISLKQEYLLRW